MYYLAVRDVKNAATTLKEERTCRNCGRDDEVIKKGIRYNKSGPMQMYYCKRCRKKFAARTGFGGMKKRAEAIVAALDLYFRGLSLSLVAQHLKASYKVEVSHKTVHNWIKKYVGLINEFVKSVNLDSARWHVDDSVVKVKGDHIRIWTLLDSETRFILAVHISKSRGAEEALKLLKKRFGSFKKT
ncbi:MAG TPA: IS6 family transposase [Crocinitomicaceae bacterium]|nr:IS6 family transposase [Crocinitomicaceae bacterium]